MASAPPGPDPAVRRRTYAALVPGDSPAHGEIDWTTASVDDGTLTVEIGGEPDKKWSGRLTEIAERLDRPGSAWGEIAIKQTTLTVASVTPGSEADLRHLLESAVLQANAEFAPEEEDEGSGDDGERSGPDREMTDRFRSFAPADDDAEDAGEDEDAPAGG